MAVDRLQAQGGISLSHKSRSLGLFAVTTAFSISLGANTALAVCAAPATQLVSGGTETAVVTFQNVNNGSGPVSAGGLTLACSSNASSTAVAGAFANLANGGAPTGGAIPSNCTPSGALNGWTTGAVSGSSVTFTSTTANTNVTDITVTGPATVATNQGGTSTLASGLGGKTICVGSTGAWTNQEYHSGTTGGSIIDWKKGASDPKDPTTTIGTWSINGNQVTYNYAASGSYSFTVWQQTNGTYDFCNGAAAVVSGAKVLTGQSAC